MIALLLALAQAQPTPAPAPRPPVEALKPIDSATAIDSFKTICWANLRDPVAFQIAITGGTIPFQQVPRRPGSPGDVYRAPEAVLTYIAPDNAPAGVPTHQCTLRVSLSGTADQLALARRVATALALPSGVTRTTAGSARTGWDIAGADDRIARLFVTTRNAAAGRTELILTALLLRPR